MYFPLRNVEIPTITKFALFFRTSSANFDVLRGRYFPGGPTPDGMDSDIMFKHLAGEPEHYGQIGDLRHNRPDNEDMITENR